MYENGVKCVGYNRKRLHRRKLKKRFATVYGYTSVGFMFLDVTRQVMKDEQRFGHPFQNWAKKYWRYDPKNTRYDGILRRAEIRKRRHQEKSDIQKMMDL